MSGRKALLGMAVVLALAVLAFAVRGPADGGEPTPVVGATAAPKGVVALGRLEPEHGLIRVGAPSLPGVTGGVLVRELLVDEGDDVAQGALLAVTDLAAMLEAGVAQAEAHRALAEREAESKRSAADSTCVLAAVEEQEAERRADWETTNVASREEAERARGAARASAAACTAARVAAVAAEAGIRVAEAALRRARADLDQTSVHAPVAGRVLAVHSRPGEAIGSRGLLELGRVDRMVAVAEVYETDIRRVARGQRATVTSAALPAPLQGAVIRIRPKVEKQDVIGTDPAALKDARIIEVEVLLDDPAPAAALSNLQVTVSIDAG